MGPICKLGSDVASSVLAGESVFSPIYCIKELIENSLDAGSKSITIQVDWKTCGLCYMSVSDTGKGIPRNERCHIGQSNHTSKISAYEDLESDQFKTLGFRGEALFVMRSLTQLGSMVLCSRTRGDRYGEEWQVADHGGATAHQRVVSCNVGTKVTLLKAFFHLPVRYQLLMGEAAVNIESLKRMVLSYSFCRKDVRFYLKFVEYNAKLKQCTSLRVSKDQVYWYKTDMTSVLINILPKFRSVPGCYISESFTSKSIDFSVSIDFSFLLESEGMGVPKIKHVECVCVNGRLISSHGPQSYHYKVSKAISELFASFHLPPPRIYYVLFEGVPNRYIDGNVEPSKTNILFTNSDVEQSLVDILVARLRSSLEIRESEEVEESLSSSRGMVPEAAFSTASVQSETGYDRTATLTPDASFSPAGRAYPAQPRLQGPQPPSVPNGNEHADSSASSEDDDNDWSFAMHDEFSGPNGSDLTATSFGTSCDGGTRVLKNAASSTGASMHSSKRLNKGQPSIASSIGFRRMGGSFIDSSTPVKTPKQERTQFYDKRMQTVAQQAMGKQSDTSQAMNRVQPNRAIKEPIQLTIDRFIQPRDPCSLHNRVRTVDSGGFRSLPFTSDLLELNRKWTSRRGVPSELIRTSYLDKAKRASGAQAQVAWSLQGDDIFVGLLQL